MRKTVLGPRKRRGSIGSLVPGMAPGAPKRNVIVLLIYVLLFLVSLSAAGIALPHLTG